MKKRVVVYGNGASARGFLTSLASDYQIKAVALESPKTESEFGYPTVDTQDIVGINHDLVIVCSWAIQEIRQRLNNAGVPDDCILWYQHSKDRVLRWGHEDCFMQHPEYQTADVLYAFYDMDVSRATFDVIGFLCLADNQRQELGLKTLQIVIVSPSNNEFNQSQWGVHDIHEHSWRLHNIVMQCCQLLPHCSGIYHTSSRVEALQTFSRANYIFPQGYSLDTPKSHYAFDLLVAGTAQGHKLNRLRASKTALGYMDNYLTTTNSDKLPIVTITLRQALGKSRRNSHIPAWNEAAAWLQNLGFFVVVVPDADAPVRPEGLFEGCFFADVASFNVPLRMALYELSDLNLGVNNGPMFLCAVNEKCHYLMFKQIVEEYPHSSTQSYIDRGFTIGGDFPGATATQKMIWQDDDFEVIHNSVLEFLDVHQVRLKLNRLSIYDTTTNPLKIQKKKDNG